MKNILPLINSNLTPEMQGILYFLASQAERSGDKIFCAGSFVRDLILGRENKKIDLIVDGSAPGFARKVAHIFPGRLTIYEKFGTATIVLSKGFVFDMITARKEFNPFSEAANLNGPGILKKYLFEKDFTVDSLACSLNQDAFGELYDYFGGLDDVHDGLLRVLYRLSFADNPLRIIRLLRLEQKDDFSIEPLTAQLLQQAISNKVLEKVSKESLYREVRLLFNESSPVRILPRLAELNLFELFFPRVTYNEELVKRLARLEAVVSQQLEKEQKKGLPGSNLFLGYLCLLFYDLTPHDVQYMLHLMRLKRKERLLVMSLLQQKDKSEEFVPDTGLLKKLIPCKTNLEERKFK